MLKKHWIHILSVGYSLCLAVASLVRINHDAIINIQFQDKIVHFMAYAVLCLLVFLSFQVQNINKSIWYAVLFAFIFGIILELLQGVTPNARVTDTLDILANTLGILVMAFLLSWKKQTLVKKLQTLM